MASKDELKALRKCEKEDCEHKIPNGVKDLKEDNTAPGGQAPGGYSSRRTGSRRIQIQEDRLQDDTAPGGHA